MQPANNQRAGQSPWIIAKAKTNSVGGQCTGQPFRKISPRYDLAAFNGPTQRPDVNLPIILGCFLLSTSLRPTSSLSIPSFCPPVRLSCNVISPSASRTSSYNCLLAFFPADAKLCRDACVHRDFAPIFAALFSSRSLSLYHILTLCLLYVSIILYCQLHVFDYLVAYTSWQVSSERASLLSYIEEGKSRILVSSESWHNCNYTR